MGDAMNGLKLAPMFVICTLAVTSCNLFIDDKDKPKPPKASGQAVWNYLEEVNYQKTWKIWPGTHELYEGREPHGMLLTTYLNAAAYDAVINNEEKLPEGAIVVKENYMPDSTFAAITTMYKTKNYDPEHNNWFWLKNNPEGVIEVEGKVEGCQNCHSAQANNDYIFTAPLGD